MHTHFRHACLATFVLCATLARAQDRPTISLAAPDPARWDAAGSVGWVGAHRTRADTFDQWSDVAAFGASAGYYWTPNIKLELQFSATTWGTVFVQQALEGGSFRFGQERFRADNLMAAVHYQFFENTWFHPFAFAGIAGTREATRLDLSEQRGCPPALPCVIIPLPRESSVSLRAGPFLGTGFKWYVAERAFIRSDIRFVLDASGLDRAEWHTGLGLDF